MDKGIERVLNKISLFLIAISTVILLYTYLRVPSTCAPPMASTTEHDIKFPSSTCDSSLSRPAISLSKKNDRLWSSNSWKSQVASFASFFVELRELGFLGNESRVLCVLAGAGHEVRALNEIGVGDVTGVELIDFEPLVKRADPNNLPFFDGVFDFAFTSRFAEALFPVKMAGEMERTVRKHGICVVAIEEDDSANDVIAAFSKSRVMTTQSVTLVGKTITRIILRVVL